LFSGNVVDAVVCKCDLAVLKIVFFLLVVVLLHSLVDHAAENDDADVANVNDDERDRLAQDDLTIEHHKKHVDGHAQVQQDVAQERTPRHLERTDERDDSHHNRRDKRSSAFYKIFFFLC